MVVCIVPNTNKDVYDQFLGAWESILLSKKIPAIQVSFFVFEYANLGVKNRPTIWLIFQIKNLEINIIWVFLFLLFKCNFQII